MAFVMVLGSSPCLSEVTLSLLPPSWLGDTAGLCHAPETELAAPECWNEQLHWVSPEIPVFNSSPAQNHSKRL